MEWLRRASLDLVYRQRVNSLLELIDAYDGEIEVFRAMIVNRFTRHRGYQVIQQIRGIGPTFAAIFIAEIRNIGRFTRPEKLTCWAGLTPRHRESDTTIHRGPITKVKS
jgi:transposase